MPAPPPLRAPIPLLLAACAVSWLMIGEGEAASRVTVAPRQRARIDYQRDVRPILSDLCFTCHGPDGAQRKGGLRLDLRDAALAELPSGRRAIVPGDPAASELLRRIAAVPAERMPPPETNKAVTPEQAKLLRRWIEEGATYAPHWAFVAPRAVEPPPVSRAAWVRDPLDAFVLHRLEEEGLMPAPEASRERLLRRVTQDLTGLPPTLEELDAFLADDAPGAWARVVDRLLASPRFGEHQARFWMDAARYGDTHGFHLDNVRSLWPWRDWVIRSFNENLPFDRFTVEQLAGDLLPAATRDQRIATGFNRCNPSTGEGGLIDEEYLAIYRSDRVETTATVWLGLTVGCARCHDHKYDPVSQREYYELAAFFASVAEGASDKNALTPPPMLAVPTPEQERRLEEIDGEVRVLRARQQRHHLASDLAQWRFEEDLASELAATWTPVPVVSALSHGGARMELREDGSVVAAGEMPERDVYEVIARHPGGRLAALRLDAVADPFRPGLKAGRDGHGNIVLTDLRLEVVDAVRPDRGTPVGIAHVACGHAQQNYPVRQVLDGDPGTGWAVAPEAHQDQVLVLVPEPGLELAAGSLLRLRLHFTSRFPRHAIRHLRLSTTPFEEARGIELGPWSVCGVIPANDGRAALHRELAPESGPLDPAARFEGGVGWTRRPELVDDRIHALPDVVGVTYLERALRVPEARTVRLAFGSDDLLKVWLDDAVVLVHDAPRGAKKDQDLVTLHLAAGEHRLRLKVVNTGGAHAFFFRIVDEELLGAPATVARLATEPAGGRSAEEAAHVRDWFRRRHDPAWRRLAERIDALGAEREALEERIPRTMVMAERAAPRPMHVLRRGAYDQPGEAVRPGVPAVLPPLPADRPADRLALARWLVDPGNPLTARVAVNRFWQQLFGTGLVATAGDFGSQGEWPSHPGLLDRLAVDFVESGWDVKALLRRLVTSATYRQDARVTPEGLARDPHNRLLARGPRYRLDAEMIRDGALAMGGLLVERQGGPGVKPYQPPGLWRAVGYTSSNTAVFEPDRGDALWRRSLYTFWKRTSPPPSMQLFDAPTREACVVRRGRTNTPLQALTLMNDVQFVEAARGLAIRLLTGPGDDAARIVKGFRIATARPPDAAEREVLERLLRGQRTAFRGDPAAARRLLEPGEAPVPEALDPVELAAWTLLASTLLNLDEAVTKG